MKQLSNVHPGSVLLHEFLVPPGITQKQLAKNIFVPASRIGAIVRKQRPITADMALRFSRYFGTTPHFWLGLQNDYDIEEETRSKKRPN